MRGLSLHAKSIRTVALAMTVGQDSMTLLMRGGEPRVATLDRACKLLRDSQSLKCFSSPFMWALDCYQTDRLSTTNILLIGGKPVGYWIKKMRRDKEMRKAFADARLELLSNLRFIDVSRSVC